MGGDELVGEKDRRDHGGRAECRGERGVLLPEALADHLVQPWPISLLLRGDARSEAGDGEGGLAKTACHRGEARPDAALRLLPLGRLTHAWLRRLKRGALR